MLRIEHLKVDYGYGRKVTHAVDDVSFDVRPGEVFGLVGESGSGKSSIGKAIMRLQPIVNGRILFNDICVSGKIGKDTLVAYRRSVQMIFQDPLASTNPHAKIFDIIAEGLVNSGKKGAALYNAVVQAMADVGLDAELLNVFPFQLSGGQLQRVCIARALVVQPALIIADEAVSSLDLTVRAQILSVMDRVQSEYGMSYLFIGHDLAMMRSFCDRIGVLCRGKLVELASADELFEHALHPYTRSLLSAISIPNPVLERNRDYVDFPVTLPSGEWKKVSEEHYVLLE